jgi:hypothetical protein
MAKTLLTRADLLELDLITRHQDVAICFCHELHEFLLNLSLFRVNSCNSWLKICALLVNVG